MPTDDGSVLENLPASVLARAQGCLLGQSAGDALGSMVEFKSARTIAALYPEGLREIGPSPVWGTLAGQPTDDTEMALFLARALLPAGFTEHAAANAYADWIESAPFDVGGRIGPATHAMAAARRAREDPVAAAHAAGDPASAANGALMRQSPLGIWGYRLDPAVLDGYARADARLTHSNPICQDASAAFLVALAATIRDGLDGRGAYTLARTWQQAHGQSAEVTETLAAAETGVPNYEYHQGYVLIALQNAFYQALHAPTLEAGVVATVMGGGDTDTNGAIAGALLGAIHGLDAIPPQWRDAVLGCRPERGAPGVGTPRPPVVWPVDALQLAAQLVQAGSAAARPN